MGGLHRARCSPEHSSRRRTNSPFHSTPHTPHSSALVRRQAREAPGRATHPLAPTLAPPHTVARPSPAHERASRGPGRHTLFERHRHTHTRDTHQAWPDHSQGREAGRGDWANEQATTAKHRLPPHKTEAIRERAHSPPPPPAQLARTIGDSDNEGSRRQSRHAFSKAPGSCVHMRRR